MEARTTEIVLARAIPLPPMVLPNIILNIRLVKSTKLAIRVGVFVSWIA